MFVPDIPPPRLSGVMMDAGGGGLSRRGAATAHPAIDADARISSTRRYEKLRRYPFGVIPVARRKARVKLA